jgi:glutamate--cysteine ligase
VLQGRHPTLTLNDGTRERSIKDWGNELLDQLLPVAQLLDKAHLVNDYQHAIEAQREKLKDADATPSAQILAHLRKEHLSFRDMALQESERTANYLKQFDLSPALKAEFETLAQESLHEQEEIEKSDTIDFEQFRQRYIAQ